MNGFLYTLVEQQERVQNNSRKDSIDRIIGLSQTHAVYMKTAGDG